jgi:peptide/nickel transport system substrate-binding protein
MAGKFSIAVSAVAVLAFASVSASAQKSKDTLRLGYYQPISTVDAVIDPQPQTTVSYMSVFDTLVLFDSVSGKIVPLLAESWKQVDPRTIEFKLRDGVKFHDGSTLSADDVVYTINWLADPGVKFRMKSRYDWIDKAEKIDSRTVRISAKEAAVTMLMQFTLGAAIFPQVYHKTFEDPANFGRKPVGTGPFRAVSVDDAKGIVLQRNPAYTHGNSTKPAARIGNIHIGFIPEPQTQVAELMVGNLDLVHEVQEDMLQELKADKRFNVTANDTFVYLYMSIDSAGRSDNHALKDVRVREAIMRAVNRDEIRKNLVAGGESAQLLDAICFDIQAGCSYSTKPPAFDPARAKALLAEAGYPQGFEIVITTTPRNKIQAEAVAGQLHAIGLKPKVEALTFSAYQKRQAEGKLQILLHYWTSGGQPDVDSTMGFFFAPGGRNYTEDAMLTTAWEKGSTIFDEAQRKAHYRAAFDRINDQKYMMIVSTLPSVFVHTKDLVIEKGTRAAFGAEFTKMHWTD